MEIIDKSFKRAPKSYIIQSILAVVAVAVILYFVEVLTHAAIVAALGSSTFIVFAMPHSTPAQARKLIGGHIIGLICGTFCYLLYLPYWSFREANYWWRIYDFVYLCFSSGIVNFSNGSY